MAVINFEIYNVLGTLSENKDGMKKQLTCTSWGRYNPKFDLRSWDSEYMSMSKGVTLTLEELVELKKLLDGVSEEDLTKVMEAALEERANAKAEESVAEETTKPSTKTKKTATKAKKTNTKAATATKSSVAAKKTSTAKKTTTTKKASSTKKSSAKKSNTTKKA